MRDPRSQFHHRACSQPFSTPSFQASTLSDKELLEFRIGPLWDKGEVYQVRQGEIPRSKTLSRAVYDPP